MSLLALNVWSLVPLPLPGRQWQELNSWSVVLGSLQHEGLSPGAEEGGITALQLPKGLQPLQPGLGPGPAPDFAHPIAHTPLFARPAHPAPFGTSCWATGWDQDTNDGKC